MKLLKKKLFSISLLLLFIPSIFIGCGKKLDYSEISSYSDEVLSTVLTALSNNDYNTFSEHLSDDMKESYDYGTFQTESALLITTVGVFESLEFDYGEKRNGYNFAIYNTKFSDEEEEVRVSVAFKEGDENHKVYELYLSSDKLEKANSTN